MNSYYINVSPHAHCGIGFISVGENENHALANLSHSLRQSLKINMAKIKEGSHEKDIYESKYNRNLEILRTIRKPGRKCYSTFYYRAIQEKPNEIPKTGIWEKVTVKQIHKPITAAYVEEVWLS